MKNPKSEQQIFCVASSVTTVIIIAIIAIMTAVLPIILAVVHCWAWLLLYPVALVALFWVTRRKG